MERHYFYTEQAEAKFLQRLRKLGYKFYYPFLLQDDDQKAFFEALALALAIHVANNYAGQESWLANDFWRGRLSNLAYTRSFNEIYASKSDTDAPALIADICRLIQNSCLYETLQMKQMPDKVSVEDWTEIADALCIYLTWYEQTGKDTLTHYFPGSEDSPLRLFVNLAQDGNLLYLLIHEEYEKGYFHPEFPFYCNGHPNKLPPPFDEELVNLQVENEIEGVPKALLVNQGALIGELLQLTKFLESIPKSSEQSLKKVKSLFDCHVSLQRGADLVAVGRLVSLMGRAPATFHTIHTCAQFPGGPTVRHLDHEMHQSCLIELLSSASVRYICPICQQILPPIILNAIWPEQYSSTVGEMPGKIACAMCSTEGPQNLMIQFQHGCKICCKCIFQNSLIDRTCPICPAILSDEDCSNISKMATPFSLAGKRFKA